MRPAGWPVGTLSPHRAADPGVGVPETKDRDPRRPRRNARRLPTFTRRPRFQVWQVQAVMIKGSIGLMELPDESRRPAGSPVLNDPRIAPLPKIVTRVPVRNPLACRRPASRPGGLPRRSVPPGASPRRALDEQSAQRHSAASGLFPIRPTRGPASIPLGPRKHHSRRLKDIGTRKDIGVLLPPDAGRRAPIRRCSTSLASSPQAIQRAAQSTGDAGPGLRRTCITGDLLPVLRTDTADYVALQNREEHP
jgi:hypothetical protein